MRACVRACVRACECLCVCVRTRARAMRVCYGVVILYRFILLQCVCVLGSLFCSLFYKYMFYISAVY